ncbi:MAG: ribonuclease P protein component [bacterium]|nr:ribonuclease P protein component [bacterium]
MNHEDFAVGKVPSGNFKVVYKGGQKAVGRMLILFFLEEEQTTSGFVASRKVGNAVHRNRAKRLLREAFRIHLGRLQKSGAFVLLARIGINGVKTPEVAEELEKLLTRLDLLSDDSKSRGM